jgi:hypothetical protein
MISELGLVYFLGSTDARKAVMVYLVSLALVSIEGSLHQERGHLLEHFLL